MRGYQSKRTEINPIQSITNPIIYDALPKILSSLCKLGLSMSVLAGCKPKNWYFYDRLKRQISMQIWDFSLIYP